MVSALLNRPQQPLQNPPVNTYAVALDFHNFHSFLNDAVWSISHKRILDSNSHFSQPSLVSQAHLFFFLSTPRKVVLEFVVVCTEQLLLVPVSIPPSSVDDP